MLLIDWEAPLESELLVLPISTQADLLTGIVKLSLVMKLLMLVNGNTLAT